MNNFPIQITIEQGRNYRTEVSINGKFAYQTGEHPSVVRDSLVKLFDLAEFENVWVTIIGIETGI